MKKKTKKKLMARMNQIWKIVARVSTLRTRSEKSKPTNEHANLETNQIWRTNEPDMTNDERTGEFEGEQTRMREEQDMMNEPTNEPTNEQILRQDFATMWDEQGAGVEGEQTRMRDEQGAGDRRAVEGEKPQRGERRDVRRWERCEARERIEGEAWLVLITLDL